MKNITKIFLFTIACFAVLRTTAQGVQNNGNMYISGDVGILGTYNFTNETGASYLNNGNLYIYADFTNNQTVAMVAGTATSSGTIWFQGAATQALNGTNDFNFYNTQLNKTANTNLVNMTRNVTTKQNLTLTKGIITTGSKLFTWENNGTGALSAPNTPWVAHTATYVNSFIATCDAAGAPAAVANATTPLTSAYGLMVKNIGTGGVTSEVYFPVGATYLTSGTGVAIPAPHRISITNTGPADNFNVVVNYGDIGGTPKPKVNRIWYINGELATNKVTMKLYFTERTTTNWPLIENEVEDLPSPFDYTNMIIVAKDYAGDPNFYAISSSTDVQSRPNGLFNDEEVYALYSVGVSPDFGGFTNGITRFNRFSITNPGNIILPVTILNLKAHAENNTVKVDWVSVDETNIDHYEVERANDGVNFGYLGRVEALNNGQLKINYSFTDGLPFGGANYYRINAVDNNARALYSNTVLVNMNDIQPGILIYPNPIAGRTISTHFNNMPPDKYSLVLCDNLGRKIAQKEVQHSGGSAAYYVNLPLGTVTGNYHLTIQSIHTKIEKTLLVQ